MTMLFSPFEAACLPRDDHCSDVKVVEDFERRRRHASPKQKKVGKIQKTIIVERTHRRQRAPFTFRAYVVRRGRDVVNEDFARLLHAIERVFGDVRFERRVRLRVHVRKLGELMLHDPLDVRAGEVVARRRRRARRGRRLNRRFRRRRKIRRGSSSSSRVWWRRLRFCKLHASLLKLSFFGRSFLPSFFCVKMVLLIKP